MSPHTGKAVCLQFHGYGKLIARSRVLLLNVAYFALDAQHVLHVVPDFVRHYICLGKLARRAVAAQLIPETEVKINLLVRRAIEGASRCPSSAASGLRIVAKQDQVRSWVADPLLTKNQRPGVLCIAQNKRGELRGAVLDRKSVV